MDFPTSLYIFRKSAGDALTSHFAQFDNATTPMQNDNELTEPKELTGTEYDMWHEQNQGRTPKSLEHSEIFIKVVAGIFFLVCVASLVFTFLVSKQS